MRGLVLLVLPVAGCMEVWPDYLKPGYQVPAHDRLDTDRGDSGGCFREVPVTLGSFSRSYDGTFWIWTLDLEGWGTSAVLDLYAAGPGGVWTESHELLNTDYDPCGQWDRWSIMLEVVASVGD